MKRNITVVLGGCHSATEFDNQNLVFIVEKKSKRVGNNKIHSNIHCLFLGDT